jgi:hypothetical protein
MSLLNTQVKLHRLIERGQHLDGACYKIQKIGGSGGMFMFSATAIL